MAVFGGLKLAQDSGLSTCNQYSNSENLVKSFSRDIQKAVEVPGIEPGRPWMIGLVSSQSTPTAPLL